VEKALIGLLLNCDDYIVVPFRGSVQAPRRLLIFVGETLVYRNLLLIHPAKKKFLVPRGAASCGAPRTKAKGRDSQVFRL